MTEAAAGPSEVGECDEPMTEGPGVGGGASGGSGPKGAINNEQGQQEEVEVQGQEDLPRPPEPR